MDPLQVIVWICVAVFALTAILSLLNLTGIYRLPDPKHGETLFKVLVVEIAVIAVAAFGNYMTGKSKIDPEKSISGQLLSDEKNITTGDSSITFTPGIISDGKAVESIKKLAPENPTVYTGRNFINKEAGFLLTVARPELWQIAYNAAGMSNSSVPVNTFTNRDGSYLTIGLERVSPGTTIEQYVQAKIWNWPLKPLVSYDPASNTAFLIATNPATMGESYMKLIINNENSTLYAAIANYNKNLSVPETLSMLSSMVASFTVITE